LEHFDAPAPTGERRRSLQDDLDRLARLLESAADGDLRHRARLDPQHPLGRIGAAADRLIGQNAQLARELNRVCRRVATDGRLSERAHRGALSGELGDALTSLNDLLEHLTWHAGETAAVVRALEQGELGRTMPLETPGGTPLKGQSLRVARSLNALVSRLRGLRSEVIRIAGEVGTAGRLGGQAHVAGASGAWKELVEAVNLLAANLTSQVRNIALVTTAVARGDLSRKITVSAQGEILEL
jgi:methyl-accepting chemotaxis protein